MTYGDFTGKSDDLTNREGDFAIQENGVVSGVTRTIFWIYLFGYDGI